jgi:hypothetical protein
MGLLLALALGSTGWARLLGKKGGARREAGGGRSRGQARVRYWRLGGWLRACLAPGQERPRRRADRRLRGHAVQVGFWNRLNWIRDIRRHLRSGGVGRRRPLARGRAALGASCQLGLRELGAGPSPGSGAASVSKLGLKLDGPRRVQAASTGGVGVSLAKEGTKRCQRPLPAWAMCVGPHLVPAVH